MTETHPKSYCMVKNSIIEALAKTRLSGYETSLLFAIIRKTYGFVLEDGSRKTSDWISLSQLKDLTGIRESHISRTTKMLVDRKILTKGGKKIGINKDISSWLNLPKGVNSHHSKNLPKGVIELTKGGQSFTKGGIKYLPKGGDTTDNKDNIQKIILQKKSQRIYDLLEEDFIYISDKYKVPLNMVKLAKEEMDNWLEAKGKSYKGFNGYKAGLRNWVLRDAKKVMEGRANGRSRVSIDINKI